MTDPQTKDEAAAVRAAGLPQPALAAQALTHLLKPLARLMIDQGLQLPAMLELLKKSLVDDAVRTYGVANKASTDTRIALLTGVHRKDVKRLRDMPDAGHADLSVPMVSLVASVVARWISDPQYLNSDQTTRPLARTPRRGQLGEPGFTNLVAEISRDVGARAVLDELARLDVVDVQDDGYVSLKSTAFVPKEGLDESFHFLAHNVSDHLATAVHNLTPARGGPHMLEQSAFALNLSATQADQLQARARQLWATSLQQFLQTATVAEQRSQTDEGPKHRVRFGVYFHDAVQDQKPVQAAAPKAARQVKRDPKQ